MVTGCCASKGKSFFAATAKGTVYGHVLCERPSPIQIFVIIIVTSPTAVTTTSVAAGSRACAIAGLSVAWSSRPHGLQIPRSKESPLSSFPDCLALSRSVAFNTQPPPHIWAVFFEVLPQLGERKLWEGGIHCPLGFLTNKSCRHGRTKLC